MGWRSLLMKVTKMKIINCTPHDVTIAGKTYPASGNVVRASSQHVAMAHPADFPMYSIEYGPVAYAPPPVPGVLNIVSMLVMQQAPTRRDFAAPASGHPDVVRVNGQIQSVPGVLINGHYQWISDTDLALVLGLNYEQVVEFRDLLTDVPETDDMLKIYAIHNWIAGEFPDLMFHILDVRPSNDGDELSWLIAV